MHKGRLSGQVKPTMHVSASCVCPSRATHPLKHPFCHGVAALFEVEGRLALRWRCWQSARPGSILLSPAWATVHLGGSWSALCTQSILLSGTLFLVDRTSRPPCARDLSQERRACAPSCVLYLCGLLRLTTDKACHGVLPAHACSTCEPHWACHPLPIGICNETFLQVAQPCIDWLLWH